MQIQSTQRTFQTHQRPPAAQPPENEEPRDLFTRQDIHAAASGLTGGLLLGAGGAYLGMAIGIRYAGSVMGVSGTNPITTLTELTAMLPLMASYGAAGAVAGSIIGGTAGAAAGIGLAYRLAGDS